MSVLGNVSRTVFWQELAEYCSGSLALQGDPYTPSTHTSLESPRNGGTNDYFAWLTTRGTIYYNVKMGVRRPKRWVYYPAHSERDCGSAKSPLEPLPSSRGKTSVPSIMKRPSSLQPQPPASGASAGMHSEPAHRLSDIRRMDARGRP
jgi:hypothetical protein